MARQENGFIGGYAGSLGPVIGYNWRGRWCVRSKPARVHNPRTDRQQSHRQLFKAMVQFASLHGHVLRVGMRQAALAEGMTEQNLFVKLNSQSFSMVDGVAEVDYSDLVFSSGPVAPVAFGAPVVDERQVLTVSFEKNPLHQRASADDTVYLYVCCPSVGGALLSAPVYRRTGCVSMMLPDEWVGQEVYVYGFVTDYAGRASQTLYAGADGVAEPDAEYIVADNVADGDESDTSAPSSPSPTAAAAPAADPGGFS